MVHIAFNGSVLVEVKYYRASHLACLVIYRMLFLAML